MSLESLIENAIKNEEMVDLGDCVLYALKDKNGNPAITIYNNDYILKKNLRTKKEEYMLIKKSKYSKMPEKLYEIFEYLKGKYDVRVTTSPKFDESLRKAKRVYHEIKRVKELLEKKLDKREIARIIYEEFKENEINANDLKEYKFYILGDYIVGINYIERHPKIVEKIEELSKKGLSDREIAKKFMILRIGMG